MHTGVTATALLKNLIFIQSAHTNFNVFDFLLSKRELLINFYHIIGIAHYVHTINFRLQ